MELKFSLPREITANVAKRTITGLIAPYNEVGYTSAGEVIFKEGAFGDIQASAIKLLTDHEMARPIGKMVSAESTPDGVVATFKLGSSTRATDALIEASEGLKNGLSVGARIVDYATDKEGRMIVSAASLREVSLVTEPAFAEARVLEVAASATPTEEEKEEPMSEPTKEEVVETAPAVEAAVPSVEAAKPTVALAYTKPRSPIVDSASYLEHTLKASFGNEDSRQYVKAADDSTTTNTGLTLAPHMQEFISATVGIRPAIDAVSRGALPASGMSFTIPKLTTAPTVAEVAEAAAPSETGMVSTYITVDVKKASGLNRVSYELLDRSSPAFYNELLVQMQRAYAKATDQALLTALIAGGTAGTAVAATAAGLQSYVATESAAAFGATGEVATNLIANTGQWAAILGYADTTGRALYTATQPMNASGSAAVSSLRGSVLGLDLYVDPFIAASGVVDDSAFIVVPSAVTWYESPTTQIQVQAVTTGEVEIALYGYYAIATKIGAGIRRFNLT